MTQEHGIETRHKINMQTLASPHWIVELGLIYC